MERIDAKRKGKWIGRIGAVAAAFGCLVDLVAAGLFGGGGWVTVDSAAVGPLYTSHNLFYGDPDEILSINYYGFNGRKILPAGTAIKAYRFDAEEDELRFTTMDGAAYAIAFQARFYKQTTLEQYARRLFTPADFKTLTSGLGALDLEGIKSGMAYPGMCKKGVVIALGYPPEHETASLNSDTWLFWRTRTNKTPVTFTAGYVTAGTAPGKAIATPAPTPALEMPGPAPTPAPTPALEMPRPVPTPVPTPALEMPRPAPLRETPRPESEGAPARAGLPRPDETLWRVLLHANVR